VAGKTKWPVKQSGRHEQRAGISKYPV